MRFSKFIFPLQVLLDVLLLEVIWYATLKINGISMSIESLAVTMLAWLISAYMVGKYRLRRYSRIPKTLQNISKLGFIYLGSNVVLQGALLGDKLDLKIYFAYHIAFIVSIMISRIMVIRLIKRYRSLGHNYRNVVILGDSPDTQNLNRNFYKGNDLGYRLKGFIKREDYNFNSFIEFVKQELIDEVFISSKTFSSSEFNQIIDYADNNLLKIRVVPNFSGVFASNLKLDYVGFQPVLVYREIALDDVVNSTVKRAFDILFSSLVMIFVLSWLIPLMALIIKLESKGDVIFKQKRSGINNNDFYCYKFRSMAVNNDANNIQATKGDMRITKVGAFIRKTSIDELPQFINVFLGDMSVVGPRPHMVKHTEEFSNVVDRYMLRHFVKPGITGLAQTKGYRGETKTKQDIKGRVTLDRFYIENWNFFLDLKIIYQTLVNGAKGEENAF